MLIVNGNNILLNHVIISADYPLKFGYLLQVQIKRKSVPLYCVFHSIRFKVNKKDWLSGIDSLFLCLNVIFPLFSYSFILSL